MTAFFTLAPWRGWFLLSKHMRKKNEKERNHQKLPKNLSEHLARDIGASPADIARLRHRWPSETNQYPRL